MALLDAFKKGNADKKEKLMVYRNAVGRDVLRTKLFFPTKALDATRCLSNAMLNRHSRSLPYWSYSHRYDKNIVR